MTARLGEGPTPFDAPPARVLGIIHKVLSTGYKANGEPAEDRLLLNFACEGWEYAELAEPAPGLAITCPDCREAIAR